MSTFGERLKMLREERGWSYADVAVKTGITENAVRQYESGTIKKPGLEKGMRLAEVFGEPLDWLVYGKGQRNATPRVASSDETVSHYRDPWPAIEAFLGVILEIHPEVEDKLPAALKALLPPQSPPRQKPQKKRRA